MRLMPITDALFLLAEAREKPMHVGGLQLFDPPEDAAPDYVGSLYREAIAHREISPQLRRRPVRPLGALGMWGWEDEADPDLEYHVRHSALPHPGRIRELLALTSRLHGTLLDRHRPLWEAHLIEGLADGRFATYTKVHHAMVDGVAAMRLLEDALTTDPDLEDMSPPWAPGPRDKRPPRQQPPLPAQVLGGATAGVRALTGASGAILRTTLRAIRHEAQALPYQAPRSVLNVPISGARRFAADKWALERINAVRGETGSTLNDVVMAMCAGALRRYLDEDLDALPDDPLLAMVPVSLRGGEDDERSNAVGLVLCNLGTHLADPAARFEQVRTSMQRGKLGLEGLTPEAVLLLSALSMAPLALGPLYRFEPLRRPPFNVIISNVPGPRQPLYWNRARLSGMYPVSIPTDGMGLNITVSTYVEHLGVGLTGCRRTVPHLQRMLEHLETSLSELEMVAGVA